MLQLSIVIIHDRDLYSKVGKAAEFPTVSWRSSSLFVNPESCWCLAQDSPLEGEKLAAFFKRPHSHGLFHRRNGAGLLEHAACVLYDPSLLRPRASSHANLEFRPCRVDRTKLCKNSRKTS